MPGSVLQRAVLLHANDAQFVCTGNVNKDRTGPLRYMAPFFVQTVCKAYLAAAGRRQNMKMGLPLEAVQPGAVSTGGELENPGQLAVDSAAVTSRQPMTTNFGDIESVALADPVARPEMTDFDNFDSTAFADMCGQVQAAQLASLQPAPVWMVWLQ